MTLPESPHDATDEESPVLTDAEARTLSWRTRRTRPVTMAGVRVGLRRAAAQHLRAVHVAEGLQ